MNIKIYMKNQERLLANATIWFMSAELGSVCIKNFSIWRSQTTNARLADFVNITPPSIRSRFGKSIVFVFFEDGKGWEKIEQRIYDAYHLEKSKGGGESVDPNDIPF